MDKTETNDLLEECMLYFKARPVYKKLFLKMRDKYAGLGHFGGTAMLTSLSREETVSYTHLTLPTKLEV